MACFTRVMNAVCTGMLDESDIYVFTSWQVLADWINFTKELFEPKGFKFKGILIWHKMDSSMGLGDLNVWGSRAEFILYFKRGNRIPSVKRSSNVFSIPTVHSNKLIHSHEKPVALLEKLIKYSTEEEDLVVDPFAGSASLAFAARNTNRNAVTCEYDEYNYQQALTRFEETSENLFS